MKDKGATLVVETVLRWKIVGLWSMFWANNKWHAAAQVVHVATCGSFTKIPESSILRRKKGMLWHVLH